MNTESVVGKWLVATRRRAVWVGQPARLWPCLALALAAQANAQAPATNPGTSPANLPPAAAAAPSDAATRERLQRDAERPMYWIRLHAEQARAAEVRKPATAPPPGAGATAAATAPPTRAARAQPLAGDKPLAVATTARPAEGSNAPATEAGPADTPLATRAEPEAPASTLSAASATALPATSPVPPTATSPAPPLAAPPDAPGTGLGGASPRLAQGPTGAPIRLELLASTEPDFPTNLVRRLRRGELQVEVEVADTGEVSGAKVLSSSHPRLNEPALQAIRGWRFRPPAQPASAVIHFKFDIDDAG